MSSLPGWELVSAGLADLAAGRRTIAGELVRSASSRLAASGLPLPVAVDPVASRSNVLYALVLAEVGPASAHARYNALRRRLSSFLRSVEHAASG